MIDPKNLILVAFVVFCVFTGLFLYEDCQQYQPVSTEGNQAVFKEYVDVLLDPLYIERTPHRIIYNNKGADVLYRGLVAEITRRIGKPVAVSKSVTLWGFMNWDITLSLQGTRIVWMRVRAKD